MSLRAVIFDMGNTLLRYSRPEQETWQQTETRGLAAAYDLLRCCGYLPTVPFEMFATHCFNQLAAGWRDAVAGRRNLRAADWLASCCHAFGCSLDALHIDALVAAYTAPLREGVEPLPDARATVEALRAEGYAVGLLSNTAWPGVIHQDDLAKAGLLPLIDHLTFSGDQGVWKPHPQIYLQTVAALNVDASEALFVGDNPIEDIKGAQQAGLRAVWMHTVEFPLGDVRPDAEIRALPELLPLLGI